MKTNLQNIFSPQAIGAVFQQLPPLKTTIIDRAFPKAVNHPLPVIGVSEVQKITGTIPVVRRGGNPITLSSGGAESTFYAPVPVMPAVDVTASDLNDLQTLLGDKTSKDAWVSNQVDTLRGIVRRTTEAIASVVLTTGKYSWPMKLEGGKFDTFTIDFGEQLSFVPAAKLTKDSKVKDAYEILDQMADKIAAEGYGEKVKFLAGRKAFGAFLDIAQEWKSSAQSKSIGIELEDGTITIGGYVVERMSEKYLNPLTETMVPKVDENELIGYAVMSEAGIYYCAIDSISAGNKALPFHIYAEQKGDTSILLQAQSKPVPVRPSKSVCKATVI